MKKLFLILICANIYSNTNAQSDIVNKGLEILNVKDVNVNIYYLDDVNLKGNAASSDALLIGKNGLYDIYVKKGLTKTELIEAISHELIHLKQFETKRLIKKEAGIVIWEGSTYEYFNIEYEDRQWEAEAFNNGRKLAKLIKNIKN
jgi:hypothetical protein